MCESRRKLPLPGGVVPVPNSLVDEVLPTLRDTELRVLLVVLRQTWGWRDVTTGKHKARDWLTSGQLQRRTGRAGEAVSSAVDGLVRRGLIVVEDAWGRPLATAEERRRHLGKLYFKPGDMWKTPGSRLPGKPKTTTYTRDKSKNADAPLGKNPGDERRTGAVVIRGEGWSRAGELRCCE
jgi:hypothetical protein